MMNNDTIETHKTLQELQKELDRLNSASQQINEVKEISQNITSNMLALQKKYQEHLKKLKEDHRKSDENHNAILEKHLENNKEAHEKLIADTDAKIAEINSVFKNNFSKSEKFQAEQKGAIDKHLQNLKDNHKQNGIQHKELLDNYLEANKSEYSKVILKTGEKISEINDAFESNIRKSEEIQKAQSKSINEHLKIYADFVKDVQALTQTIKQVDFPNRLDKLDNTVSAINLGIQNTQTAIANTERNIAKKMDEQIEKTQNQYKLTDKTNNIIKLSVWIVGCISILLLVVITYKIFQ